MQITVRRAEPGDVDWILCELAEFAQFYGTKHSLFGNDYAYNSAVLKTMIEKHCVFVAVRGAETLGFIAGVLAPHHFNPELKVLSEYFWWVKEEARCTRAGLLLLNAFTIWGRANADWITLTLIEDRSPIAEKSLEKRGYHLHERSYLLEVG